MEGMIYGSINMKYIKGWRMLVNFVVGVVFLDVVAQQNSDETRSFDRI